MIEAKHHIACFFVFLSLTIYGQNENALDNAQREYERGNYERSLSYLNAGAGEEFSDKAIAIKNLWLLSENYIELQYPEQQIIENLKTIYTIDPLFTKEKYNLDVSGRVENRMNTIQVYPNWVFNISASRDLILPLVVKESYICEECIESDKYSYSEFGSNLSINLTYFYTDKRGVEAGIGYASSNYARNIDGKSKSDENSGYDRYSVSYNERLQFIDFPLRYVIKQQNWSFRVGVNYKYLIQSDAKLYHTYIDKFDEQTTELSTKDNLQKIRNKNLVFLGINIDRKIFPPKDKSLWYLSLTLHAQMGLNSFISGNHRFSDINAIYDTYYTDDSIKLAMIGLGIRFNYNANYKIQ